jgi:fatty acid desaturase
VIDQHLPLTVRGELKNGVNWILEHIIVRHVFLILALMMLLKEKLPGVAWAEALSLLAQIIMYAILGSMALTGFVVLLLIGFWLVTCLFNLGLWALHLATGEPEGRDLGY